MEEVINEKDLETPVTILLEESDTDMVFELFSTCVLAGTEEEEVVRKRNQQYKIVRRNLTIWELSLNSAEKVFLLLRLRFWGCLCSCKKKKNMFSQKLILRIFFLFFKTWYCSAWLTCLIYREANVSFLQLVRYLKLGWLVLPSWK